MTIEITKGNKNPVSDFFSSVAQTPETDYEQFDGFDGQGGMVVGVEFARRLERERDEAREENAKLRDIAEWAIDNIFHKCTEDLIRAELKELKQLK